MSANATARFKRRRREKEVEAFAKSALAEATRHSQPVKEKPIERPTAIRKESWHMTYRGEWRVENEEQAYETKTATPEIVDDIHESGLKEMLPGGKRGGGVMSPQDCFFRKDMEERGVA